MSTSLLLARRRYRDQLAYLLEGGARLASDHPRLANMLAGPGSDPDVERLLEGIAYFAGQVEAKQADQLPLLLQLVFDVFFPHYLSPLPAAAVVQLERQDGVSVVPAGSEVESVPVDGTPCRFRTTYEVAAEPLAVTHAGWRAGRQQGRLSLQLGGVAATLAGRPAGQPDRLRLYLHGEPLLTCTLYRLLTTRLERVRWSNGDQAGLDVGHPPAELRVEGVGLAETERLLPYPPGSPSGLRLLQEYFTLPQKFLFVDLVGFYGALARRVGRAAGGQAGSGGDEVELEVELRTDGHQPLQLGSRNFRLGCTPVVNVFPHTADPVQRGPLDSEISIRPAGQHGHYEIYRLLKVSGQSERGLIDYPLLNSLECRPSGGAEEVVRFCQLHRRELPEGEGARSHVRIHEELPINARPTEETVMADLLCTNGRLPLGLRVGDICQVPGVLAGAFPGLGCRNITAVSPPVDPPRGALLRHALVSHLALAQREMSSLPALHAALDLYNFRSLVDLQAGREHDLLLEALRAVETSEARGLLGGDPVRGIRTEVTIDESVFGSPGELHLFGCVIDRVLSTTAPINHFTEFALRRYKDKGVERWPKRLADQKLSC